MRVHQCKAKVVVNKLANKIYITQPHHTHTPDYAQFCNEPTYEENTETYEENTES